MPLHGKNFIGRGLSADGTEIFRTGEPATGRKLEPAFHNATPAEVNRALELAERAFRSRRRRDAKQDAALLAGIAAEIELLGEELIERATAETGLPAARIKGETARTTGQLRLFADLVRDGSWVDARIDRALPDRKPAPRPDVRRMLIPIGPVAVFPASNFPLAISVAGSDTAAAFAAGCPVIVKARPSHAGTSELVAQAVQKAVIAAELPDGWFSMFHGASWEMSVRLVQHPAIRAAAFTGSIRGGRTLFDAAASRPDPIPVYAEMGSINPVFLLPGAVAERGEQIARGLHQSVTLGAGQFCTNPGLVIAMKDPPLEQFLGTLAALIRDTPLGTMLVDTILDGYEQGARRLAAVPGVEQLSGSTEEPDRGKTQCRTALFATDATTFLENHRLREEVFGPSTLVVPCRTREEMFAIAECLDGQLTATLHGTEHDLAESNELLAILETKAGRLLFNGFPTGVEVCAAMNHGGPYPATTDPHFTSVGTAAILRFARPVCYQDFSQAQLPPELRDENELGIWRMVDNRFTRDRLQ